MQNAVKKQWYAKYDGFLKKVTMQLKKSYTWLHYDVVGVLKYSFYQNHFCDSVKSNKKSKHQSIRIFSP